jgi:hypothetical protein
MYGQLFRHRCLSPACYAPDYTVSLIVIEEKQAGQLQSCVSWYKHTPCAVHTLTARDAQICQQVRPAAVLSGLHDHGILVLGTVFTEVSWGDPCILICCFAHACMKKRCKAS